MYRKKMIAAYIDNLRFPAMNIRKMMVKEKGLKRGWKSLNLYEIAIREIRAFGAFFSHLWKVSRIWGRRKKALNRIPAAAVDNVDLNRDRRETPPNADVSRSLKRCKGDDDVLSVGEGSKIYALEVVVSAVMNLDAAITR